MRVSKFIKADVNILLEYIYDDNNNISEPYDILVNIKNNTQSYIAGQSSTTINTIDNQLFNIDPVTNNYGLVNTTNYSFLQVKNFAIGFPLRHDTLKIHLPVNYTFGQYLGCYVRVYTYDYNNVQTYDLSNFFFDATDVAHSTSLGYTSPPFLFQEQLWGKNISIDFPSPFAVANQRVNGSVKPNSVNYTLTNGLGLSLNSPIFIDFHFITTKKTINKVTTYYLTSKTPMSVPQTPDFEKLGVAIIHSNNGDYFEIYGTYNGNIAEFNDFIINSTNLGNRYYVTYTITLYEQNILGKSFTITVTSNFNETVEYRPVIKYSTTTAVIDVEMNVIDAVDNSSILRRPSYGMLQDEVSKYSLNLTKINLRNAHKPKIYNIKSPEGAGIFGNSTLGLNQPKPQIYLDPIKVNYTVLTDKLNIVAKSDSVQYGNKYYWGIGKLQIMLHPFDNVIQFIIANNVDNSQKTVNSGNGTKFEYITAPEYLDLTNMGTIKMIIKNDKLSAEFQLYMASNQVDLSVGQVVFKIPASKLADIRKIYDSGINVFYITSTQDVGTTVIYSGLFTIYDSTSNVTNLNTQQSQIQSQILTGAQNPSIISDPNSGKTGTAIVTRKIVPNNGSTATQSVANSSSAKNTVTTTSNSTAPSTSTSLETTTKIGGVVYTVTSESSLKIDGYVWSPGDLKSVLGFTGLPTKLSIQSDSLYSNGKYLDKLADINKKLIDTLDTPDKKSVHTQTTKNYKNNLK